MTSCSKSRFVTFELETLMAMGPKVVVPVVTYLFHRIDQRLDGRPTLVVLDEAWIMLTNSVFGAKIEEWLRTLRKKNAAVVLATQSLTEIANSPHRDVILESCPTKLYLPNPEAKNAATPRDVSAVRTHPIGRSRSSPTPRPSGTTTTSRRSGAGCSSSRSDRRPSRSSARAPRMTSCQRGDMMREHGDAGPSSGFAHADSPDWAEYLEKLCSEHDRAHRSARLLQRTATPFQPTGSKSIEGRYDQ